MSVPDVPADSSAVCGPIWLILWWMVRVAIRTAMDMSPTNSFGFRATGKSNIFQCRYMGMAKIAKTWCVGKGGQQDCYGHVPHQLLWVQDMSIAVLMATFPYTPSFSYLGHSHVPAQEDVALASSPEPKGVSGEHVHSNPNGHLSLHTKF